MVFGLHRIAFACTSAILALSLLVFVVGRWKSQFGMAAEESTVSSLQIVSIPMILPYSPYYYIWYHLITFVCSLLASYLFCTQLQNATVALAIGQATTTSSGIRVLASMCGCCLLPEDQLDTVILVWKCFRSPLHIPGIPRRGRPHW